MSAPRNAQRRCESVRLTGVITGFEVAAAVHCAGPPGQIVAPKHPEKQSCTAADGPGWHMQLLIAEKFTVTAAPARLEQLWTAALAESHAARAWQASGAGAGAGAPVLQGPPPGP